MKLLVSYTLVNGKLTIGKMECLIGFPLFEFIKSLHWAVSIEVKRCAIMSCDVGIVIASHKDKNVYKLIHDRNNRKDLTLLAVSLFVGIFSWLTGICPHII